MTKENKTAARLVYKIGAQYYGDLHEGSDIPIMLLICVELDTIPLLHKLKLLYKRLPVLFFFNGIYYTLYKLYTKMAVYYPTRACAKGLSNWFCPSVSFSVCQSGEKILNLNIDSVNNFQT